jgi:hypothetical protein
MITAARNSAACSPHKTSNRLGALRSRFERWYPCLAACLAVLVWWLFFLGKPIGLDTGSLMQTVLTVSSITIGFLTTAKSIVASSNSRLLRDMRIQGSYAKFIQFMTRATMASFACVAFSAVGLLCAWGKPTRLNEALFAVWLFASVYAAFATFRSVHLFCLYLEIDAQSRSV